MEAFKMPPLMSYKRDKNLRDVLVKSDIGPQKTGSIQQTFKPLRMGNFPCLRCSCCSNLLKGDTFTHPQTGKSYKIKQRFTCTSSFVVYVITCLCGMYYVGETMQEIRHRITKHKSTIRMELTDLPVPAHFLSHGHSISQLRFRVIDGVPPLRRGGDRQWLLKRRELFWIFTLDAMVPKGLNLEYKTGCAL